MQVIQNTPPAQIAELQFVKEKYVENYNACHREKIGELMYHRQVIHFKQAIVGNDKLKTADPFSLYACFATAAVNGYSLDPADGEVYLIPRDGKACLDRQAGAFVRRLIRTGQIKFCEQAKLVFEGDDFKVVNGRVVSHEENFKTDVIIAGYVRMVVDENGTDRFFIYRKSDFESWRKKSPNPRTYEKSGSNGSKYLVSSLWDNGVLNGTQPEPNFLRTKIVKHAAKEKCWATGLTPVILDNYTEVEIESGMEDTRGGYADDHQAPPVKAGDFTPIMIVSPPSATNAADAENFDRPAQQPAAATVIHESDEF